MTMLASIELAKQLLGIAHQAKTCSQCHRDSNGLRGRAPDAVHSLAVGMQTNCSRPKGRYELEL